MDWKQIKTLEELKAFKNKLYGPSGEIARIQEQLKKAPPLQKPVLGQRLQTLKVKYHDILEQKAQEIAKAQTESLIKKQGSHFATVVNHKASLHPFSIVANRFRKWLYQNGYYETEGSEIESDEFNFERLNISKDHPARAMQDTLYFDQNSLLRTHNTGFTARELNANPNKAFAHFSIGNVYRNDEDDMTHSHQFTQVDLASVGSFLFGHLIWTIKKLVSYVLEKDCEVRLRPSYFPFTEPSVEVDVFYNDKWIEIAGAGMIHKKVLVRNGYSNDMNGIAAGIGLDRVAMIKYDIGDLRSFYQNDLRFLRQFKETG